MIRDLTVMVKPSLYKPGHARGLDGIEAPKSQDSRYKKVVRLSAISTDHLYPPGNIAGT